MGSVQSGRRNNIEGDMGRGREEVFTYAAFVCVVVLRENRHKNGCLFRRLGRKSYVMYMMIECLPETSLPS